MSLPRSTASHFDALNAVQSIPSSIYSAKSRWVIVSNLPREANENWLRMLFAPVGIVELVDFATAEGAGSAYLLFNTVEQALAALQLDGLNALGINLQVRLRAPLAVRTDVLSDEALAFARRSSTISIANHSQPSQATLAATTHSRLRNGLSSPLDTNTPAHKNLYVLNLPLDATTDQLTALFTTYGSVVHCVILAMLDAQARRRGFIDMSSPKEAKEAIEGLNGFVWHGYPIEVSYAIVQRSGGPFDQNAGRNIIKRNVPRNRFNTGPRRVPSDSAIDSSMLSGLTQQFERLTHHAATNSQEDMQVSGLGEANEPVQLTRAVVDPFTVFIAGLDPTAVIDDSDLHQALESYGPITAATLCRDENGLSRGFGIVTFTSQQAATNACESIHGKMINGRRLAAHKYIYQATQPSSTTACSTSPSPFPQFPSTGMDRRALTPTLPASQASIMPHANLLNNATALPQLPLLPMRFTHRTSTPQPSWSGNNHLMLSQRPSQVNGFETITASNSSTLDTFGSLQNSAPPLLFKAHTGNRAVEIKPDPNDLCEHKGNGEQSEKEKKLGEAFVPKLSASKHLVQDQSRGSAAVTSHDVHRTSVHQKAHDDDSAAPNRQPILTRTPNGLESPWSTGTHASPNSLILDAMSPQSVLSTGSAATSTLNTPEVLRNRDATAIWSSHSTNNPSSRHWSEQQSATQAGLKHAGMTGSALLSLQSDTFDKSSRTSMHSLNPVGHEKTSSPLRVIHASGKNNATTTSGHGRQTEQ